MSGKVERAHLRRAAYVYVRQSTTAQVERNTESLERQYELVDRAAVLGWGADDVVVVDRDLGVSAKSTEGRKGFERLVADVGLGKVGIVLGIEVSRLARRNADWYQLLDLCALTDTLLADADGIYHPGLHNNRMLLGLSVTDFRPSLTSSRMALRAAFPRCRLVIWLCPTTSLTSARSSLSTEGLGGGTGSGGGRAGWGADVDGAGRRPAAGRTDRGVSGAPQGAGLLAEHGPLVREGPSAVVGSPGPRGRGLGGPVGRRAAGVRDLAADGTLAGGRVDRC